MIMNYRSLLLMFICFISLCFYGCGAAVIGTAGYTGYKGATDKRTVGTMVDDTVISTTVKSKMIGDEFIKARHIDVDVLNGVVYLIGVVESASQKRMAADVARTVDGVKQVVNQLVVGSTTAGQILNDTILSSKIRTELIKTPNIRSTNVDIDTHNNIVTITGIVSSRSEKEKVLQVVQRVSGNRQVVDNLSVGN